MSTSSVFINICYTILFFVCPININPQVMAAANTKPPGATTRAAVSTAATGKTSDVTETDDAASWLHTAKFPFIGRRHEPGMATDYGFTADSLMSRSCSFAQSQ